MKKNDAQLYAAFHCMQEGGSFASSLACAWFHADSMNKERIEKTWPELIAKFIKKVEVKNG